MAYTVLMQTVQLDRPVGRLGPRQQDNILIDIKVVR